MEGHHEFEHVEGVDLTPMAKGKCEPKEVHHYSAYAAQSFKAIIQRQTTTTNFMILIPHPALMTLSCN
jgi:hypothetical protein